MSVSGDVLRKIDQAARQEPGASRSSVVEAWLRVAAERKAQIDLDRAIADYYDNVSDRERGEDADWARVSTVSFFKREAREAQQSAPTRPVRRRAGRAM